MRLYYTETTISSYGISLLVIARRATNGSVARNEPQPITVHRTVVGIHIGMPPRNRVLASHIVYGELYVSVISARAKNGFRYARLTVNHGEPLSIISPL